MPPCTLSRVCLDSDTDPETDHERRAVKRPAKRGETPYLFLTLKRDKTDGDEK